MCLQCSTLGIEPNCQAMMTGLGTTITGPIADICRARFRNIYGQPRTRVLDNYAPLWGTGVAAAAAAIAGLDDTVPSVYPSMVGLDWFPPEAVRCVN